MQAGRESTNQDGGAWQDDFPIRQEVEDGCGKLRVFTISCHEGEFGFTVRAVEEGRQEGGYEFGAHSATSPYSALGRVRSKMRRGLATRYLGSASGRFDILHDRMRGRIDWSETRGIHVVVDGVPLDMDDVARIFSSFEGWEFELTIVDALD